MGALGKRSGNCAIYDWAFGAAKGCLGFAAGYSEFGRGYGCDVVILAQYPVAEYIIPSVRTRLGIQVAP